MKYYTWFSLQSYEIWALYGITFLKKYELGLGVFGLDNSLIT